MNKELIFDKIYGCLLGGCIGDAMGAPTENMSPEEITAKYGEVRDFDGAGTDDTLLRHYLCDALIKNGGYITADQWAEEFRLNKNKKEFTRWYWTPVANANLKLNHLGIAPMECGNGNMASSSTAMCNSPMGLVNAGSPREAALEAYMVASLIHHNHSRYAASAMAAAVAEAMNPKATVESILTASTCYLPQESAAEYLTWHNRILELLSESPEDYQHFRERVHEVISPQGWVLPDARDTVPSALALFALAKGDPIKTIIYGANFGRDTDTIACMAGGLAGAYSGAGAFPDEWIAKVKAAGSTAREKSQNGEAERHRDQEHLAGQLTELVLKRLGERKEIAAIF